MRRTGTPRTRGWLRLIAWSIGAALALAGCASSTTVAGGASGSSGGKATGVGGSTGRAGGGGASNRTGTGGTRAGTGGTAAGTGGTRAGTGGTAAGTSGSGGTRPTYDEVKSWIETYKSAHPGNGGKDWDINAKTPAELAADPDAQRLQSLCGKDQLPVIPLIAWEYGGSDHQWINPQASALVYCVYIPVNPGTPNWNYDPTTGTTTADVYVLFPEQNPCKGKPGADQVLACLGDPTNIEILVDTINLNDGADVGLSLSSSPTEVMLVQPDGTKIHLYSAT